MTVRDAAGKYGQIGAVVVAAELWRLGAGWLGFVVALLAWLWFWLDAWEAGAGLSDQWELVGEVSAQPSTTVQNETIGTSSATSPALADVDGWG